LNLTLEECFLNLETKAASSSVGRGASQPPFVVVIFSLFGLMVGMYSNFAFCTDAWLAFAFAGSTALGTIFLQAS